MKQLTLSKLIPLAFAGAMVVIGLVVSYATENPPIVTDSRHTPAVGESFDKEIHPASTATALKPKETTKEVLETPAPPASKLPSLYPAQNQAKVPEPAPLPPLLPPNKPIAPKKEIAGGKLPPFQPPDWSIVNVNHETSGRSPAMLWLAGVIQGEPKVALLRRGEERYLVKEGETFDGVYKVVSISSNSVTLQKGKRKLTLRVGE